MVAFGMTFFEFFDVPVYWPILLLYFLSLFVLTMKRQIRHMIKHRYKRDEGGIGFGKGAHTYVYVCVYGHGVK